MKSLKLAKLAMAPALGALLTVNFAAAPVFAGTNTGGGGDNLAAHFGQVAQRLGTIYQRLCNSPENSSKSVCGFEPKFRGLVAKPRIVPRLQVLASDGTPREAGPDGWDGVQLATPAWAALISQPSGAERAVLLVAHEFLILAGAERGGADQADTYVESPKLISMMKDNFIDLNAVLGKAPANPDAPAAKVPVYWGEGSQRNDEGWSSCGYAQDRAETEALALCHGAGNVYCHVTMSYLKEQGSMRCFWVAAAQPTDAQHAQTGPTGD